jgi:hypothetical protein
MFGEEVGVKSVIDEGGTGLVGATGPVLMMLPLLFSELLSLHEKHMKQIIMKISLNFPESLCLALNSNSLPMFVLSGV